MWSSNEDGFENRASLYRSTRTVPQAISVPRASVLGETRPPYLPHFLQQGPGIRCEKNGLGDPKREDFAMKWCGYDVVLIEQGSLHIFLFCFTLHPEKSADGPARVLFLHPARTASSGRFRTRTTSSGVVHGRPPEVTMSIT